jgi:hypothetical protein
MGGKEVMYYIGEHAEKTIEEDAVNILSRF